MAFIFWGVVLIAIGALWIITLSGFIASRFSSSRVAKWLGAIPFFGLSLILLFMGGMIAHAFISSDNPKTIFEQEFGFKPPADVKNLNSSYYSFGDFGESYLKFQAAPSTIQRITKTRFTKLTTSETAEAKKGITYFVGNDTPVWWKPKATPQLQIWDGKPVGSFHTESITLYYDSKTQWAHYSYTGID